MVLCTNYSIHLIWVSKLKLPLCLAFDQDVSVDHSGICPISLVTLVPIDTFDDQSEEDHSDANVPLHLGTRRLLLLCRLPLDLCLKHP